MVKMSLPLQGRLEERARNRVKSITPAPALFLALPFKNLSLQVTLFDPLLFRCYPITLIIQ